MNYMMIVRIAVCICLFFPLNAFAYLGPGMGAGTIGAILGVLGSLLLAIFAVVYYPIKRMFKKRKNKQSKKKSISTEMTSDSQDSGNKE